MEVTLIYNETIYTEAMSTVDDFLLFHGNTTDDANLLPYRLRITLIVLLSTILTVGVFGNTLAIYIFLRTKALRTPPNFLIVNLSVSDLAMIICNCPIILLSIHYGYWHLGESFCNIYAFLGSICSFVSIGSMAAIALDRYYVICHCFHALMNVSRSRTMVIIFLVWLYACLWSLPPFVGIGAYIEEGFGIGCTFDYITRNLTTQIHIALLYVGGFALPILTIIICYVKIVLTVRKHRKEIESYSAKPALSKDQKGSTQSKKTSMAIQRRGATTKFSRLMAHYQLSRVGIIATVIFTLSWGPYAIIALYSQFQQNNQTLNSSFQVMPVVFAKMSCIWNPFVYALSHKRFKKALIQTTRSFFRCSNTRASTHNDSQQMNLENSASGSSLRNRSYVLHSSELSKSSQGINLNQKQRAKTPVGYRHSDPGNLSQTKQDLEIDTNTSNKLEGSKEIALEVISGSSSLRDGVHRSSWHAHHRGHISSVIGNNYV